MPDTPSHADIFLEAAAYVREHGLCKTGGFVDTYDTSDNPPCCAYGTVGLVESLHDARFKDLAKADLAGYPSNGLTRLMEEVFLATRARPCARTVERWSDSPGTTPEDVALFLEECARQAAQS